MHRACDDALEHALRTLLPPVDAAARDHGAHFEALATLLLTRVTWHAGDVRWRLAEVEFYWHGRAHRDPFTHGDSRQHTFARWYHHREGSSYRGGSFKGLDLTLGAPDVAAGVLIRAVVPVEGGACIDGPSRTVDALLAATGSPDVATCAEDGARLSQLRLDGVPHAGSSVVASPRVGLTLKRGVDAARVCFLAAPYRFVSEPHRIKKGRAQLVVGLARAGASVEEITARTGSPRASVQRAVDAWRLGMQGDPATFAAASTTAELCALLGACEAARLRAWA